MLLKKERELIVEYCKKLHKYDLTTGTSGNISILNKESNMIAISPSGIDYDTMQPKDVVIVDNKGKVIDGKLKPSSELALHLAFYNNKRGAVSVVHCHSLFASVLAAMNRPIEALHYVIGDAHTSEIPYVPYVTFGTQELADTTIDYCKESRACILGNHGQITYGRSVQDAFSLAINVEYLAKIQYYTMAVEKPKPLSPKQMEEVLKRFETYGQPSETYE